jgi:hypothetical protein
MNFADLEMMIDEGQIQEVIKALERLQDGLNGCRLRLCRQSEWSEEKTLLNKKLYNMAVV